MIERIAFLIKRDMEFNPAGETRAEAMRCAALSAQAEFPHVTASQFGDAAATLGHHRQGATNRFREAMKWAAELDNE